MTVKELIEKLQKCNPESVVCVEANSDCIAEKVVSYTTINGEINVYVCDNTDYLDDLDCFTSKEVIK